MKDKIKNLPEGTRGDGLDREQLLNKKESLVFLTE